MWTLIEKEFLENLLNLRFLIGTLVAVLLTVGCIMLQASDFSRRQEDYRSSTAAQEEYNKGFETRESFMMGEEALIPPEPLSPLANGLQAEHVGLFDENFVPRFYPVLDLVFIVAVIMSLMAILFSHDAICGERERGTLKLIQSNPLPRPYLVLAKWLGGSSSVIVPLVVSLLAGMIYISLSPRLQLGVTGWAEVLLILVASIVFISIFYLLGLLLSTLSRGSATAVLVSVMLWAIFVFIIPSLGPCLAERIEPVASVDEKIQKSSSAAYAKYYAEVERQADVISHRYELEYGQMFREYRSWNSEETFARTGMDAPGSPVRTMGLKYRKEVRDAQSAIYDARNKEDEQLNDRIKQEWARQTRLSRNFSALSPYADYVYLVTDLAGTGLESREYDKRQADAFQILYGDYSGGWFQKVQSTNTSDFDKLGFNPEDRPRFVYQPQPLAERLKAVLPYGAALLVFNLLFFAGAYVAFLKYDVR